MIAKMNGESSVEDENITSYYDDISLVTNTFQCSLTSMCDLHNHPGSRPNMGENSTRNNVIKLQNSTEFPCASAHDQCSQEHLPAVSR